MVEVFGVELAVHFNLKDLGLNAGLWGCFRTVQSWIMGLIV